MSNYIPTIGLEIHVELKTRTKMFCDSPNNPEESRPNVNVCPVCLGHPGTLPTINKEAVKSVIRVGMALGGEINPETKFDRKNYFYPDLPKGYQISQYDKPLVLGGSLNGVTLTRIHLEEDTGRLLHSNHPEPVEGPPSSNVQHPTSNSSSLVDFNRAGVPLMELVTEPDIKSAEEAVSFAKELQLILRYLGVSDADMERGQMRVEVNISLGKWLKGVWKQGTKVEIKNLNSFSAVAGAIEYETKRQENILRGKAERPEVAESRTTPPRGVGARVHQETRGWDDIKGITVSQRSKEEAHDYRYFPEPDLPPFETSALNLEELNMSLPELPDAKRDRFKRDYKISDLQLELLVQNKIIAEYFEEMDSELLLRLEDVNYRKTKGVDYPNETIKLNVLRNARARALNYLVNDLQGFINLFETNLNTIRDKVPPSNLAYLALEVEFGVQGQLGMEEGTEIGRAATQKILEEMFRTGTHPQVILEREKDTIYTISNESELEKVVKGVIQENPAAVTDYQKGKTASIQFLIGKAMSKLKGRGDPKILEEFFKKYLS